jgi:UDP-N-acetyl-D-mannosaminuronic acid transferase (WecB/TagA/CpsF family)
MGTGGSFDIQAGVQVLGLKWLYRLCQARRNVVETLKNYAILPALEKLFYHRHMT